MAWWSWLLACWTIVATAAAFWLGAAARHIKRTERTESLEAELRAAEERTDHRRAG
jgi:type II secretory pathway component PulJ